MWTEVVIDGADVTLKVITICGGSIKKLRLEEIW